MSAEIFGSAVDDNVSTERKGTLQIRREECIVDDRELAVLSRDLGNRFDVSDGKKRVCRCLYIDCFYVIVDSFLNSFKIRCVYDLICDVEVLENIIKYPERSAIDVVRYNKFVTALEKRENRVDRCKSRCKCKSVFTVL